MTLEQFFKEHPRVAFGFSGGVDSSYLLYAGLICGADIKPYYIKTAFQPQFELKDARRLAEQLGTELTVIEEDILSHAAIAANQADRCYHCKGALFSRLKERASADGYTMFADGTNASDNAGDRPGIKALGEMGIRSPLNECGLKKEEIRQLCKKAGLFVWDKPAYSCLATRIPTWTAITREVLRKIEKAEEYMMELGFSDFRVRYFYGSAKVQVRKEQFEKTASLRSKVLSGLTRYFDNVLLDFKTR